MDHQQMIATFVRKRDASAVFSDYGTGKSLCALMVADQAKMKRVLVVSTKISIKSTWPDEVMKHTNHKFVVLSGTPKYKLSQLNYGLALASRQIGNYWDDPGSTVIFLVNYDGIKNIFHQVTGVKWDMVVCDESTKIKSTTAIRTKILWAVGKHVKRKVIMTGFPVTERLSEIYAQFKFLGLSDILAPTYHDFIHHYFVRTGGGLVPMRNSVKQIIEKIRPYTIRVTNESLKLPPQIYKTISVDLTSEQNLLLKELNETYKLEFGKVQIDTQHIFTLVSKSLQICDGFVQDQDGHIGIIDSDKDEALLDTLDQIDVTRNKVVIWCAFLFSIKKLAKILSKFNIPVLTMTGATKNENEIVRKFQTSKTHNVFLATQKKAAESITLTSAKYAIYYSNIWSYDSRGNSEARIRRKGSEKHDSIMYIDILTKDSVEQQVYQCLRKKKSLIDSLKKAFSELGGKHDITA